MFWVISTGKLILSSACSTVMFIVFTIGRKFVALLLALLAWITGTMVSGGKLVNGLTAPASINLARAMAFSPFPLSLKIRLAGTNFAHAPSGIPEADRWTVSLIFPLKEDQLMVIGNSSSPTNP